MLGKCIGIDLGTAHLVVFEQGRGVVLDEPALAAVDERDEALIAVAGEARGLIGHDGVRVVRPMRDGSIPDDDVLEAMLRHAIDRAAGRFGLVRPEVRVGVPAGATAAEQRTVREAAEAAGARTPVYLVPEPLAAAVGAEVPVGSPRGHMLVDLGGARTEVAVLSAFGIVASESLPVGGDRLDQAIARHMMRRHDLIVGERTAEEVKIAIGSALHGDIDATARVRGRDRLTGHARTTTVHASEVTQAVERELGHIAAGVRRVLGDAPPDLASDVIDHGIVLTGGGALLRHLDELLTHETGMPVHVAEDPQWCVARGAVASLDLVEAIEQALPPPDETPVAEW